MQPHFSQHNKHTNTAKQDKTKPGETNGSMFLILILVARSVDAARRVVTLAPTGPRVVTFATLPPYAASTGPYDGLTRPREGLTCTFVHCH